MKRQALTKADRLRKSSEYIRLAKNGNRRYIDSFIVVSRKNSRNRSRLGITVSKKVGKAVKRNQIKRIIRETFRLNRHLLQESRDINIIARPAAGKIEPDVLRRQLKWSMGSLEAQSPKKVR